jgi:hypothetical protein
MLQSAYVSQNEATTAFATPPHRMYDTFNTRGEIKNKNAFRAGASGAQIRNLQAKGSGNPVLDLRFVHANWTSRWFVEVVALFILP